MPLSEQVEKLYDESERLGNIGDCPYCVDYEFWIGEPAGDRVLCYICGICFKYHHDANFCDPVDDTPDIP